VIWQIALLPLAYPTPCGLAPAAGGLIIYEILWLY